MSMQNIFVSLSLILAGLQVRADVACESVLGQDHFVMEIIRGAGAPSPKISVNGEQVPSVGPCIEMSRPSSRHLRCSYANQEIRLEVYVWAETTAGVVKSPGAILWRGTEPTILKFECRSPFRP